MKKRIRGIYEFAKVVLRDYSENNGSMAAAAVSFYVFLSLIPLLILAIAIIGYALGSEQNVNKVLMQYFQQYWPAAASDSDAIVSLMKEVISHRGAATGLGIFTLLWAGISTISTLESAINVAWNVPQRRGYIRKQLTAFGLFIAVTALLGASFLGTSAIRAVGELGLHWSWILSIVGHLLPIIVTVGAFVLIYKSLPYTHVPWRHAVIGGVFAGILWEIAKQVFSFYVTHFSDYSKIYGSLGGLILLAAWINYSAIVTILGAEVASEAAK